ncbi:CRISPR-associated endonuclease Cas1 1 [anaerobic digester metagenome]
MQLMISSYGASIHKKSDSFIVKTDGKTTEIPIVKIESIWISSAATLSTDVIQAALEKNIDIVFLDHFGNPYGRIWHPRIGSTTRIRRKQLEVSTDHRGLDLVKGWNRRKMQNQADFLKRLKHNRPDDALLEDNIQEIERMINELNNVEGLIDEKRNKILGIEGMASRSYFEAVAHVLPDDFKFKERSRHPAHDAFNATLNYGYGVLYSMVERGCILSGLDPYVGILHTDDYNKLSFVFDLIEIFRTHVDEVVVFLFTRRKMHNDHFESFHGGIGLSKEGKSILMTDLQSHFDKEIPFHGKNMQIRNTILAECHAIANQMIKGDD